MIWPAGFDSIVIGLPDSLGEYPRNKPEVLNITGR